LLTDVRPSDFQAPHLSQPCTTASARPTLPYSIANTPVLCQSLPSAFRSSVAALLRNIPLQKLPLARRFHPGFLHYVPDVGTTTIYFEYTGIPRSPLIGHGDSGCLPTSAAACLPTPSRSSEAFDASALHVPSRPGTVDRPNTGLWVLIVPASQSVYRT
jgi:hypothetical protein